jgi:hypothetical protein
MPLVLFLRIGGWWGGGVVVVVMSLCLLFNLDVMQDHVSNVS